VVVLAVMDVSVLVEVVSGDSSAPLLEKIGIMIVAA
jgi:hypothetical protein